MQLSDRFPSYVTPQPLRLLKVMIDHLPFFLLADVGLCIAALPTVIAWIVGMPILSLWLAVITLAPAWAWISASANTLVHGQTILWRTSLSTILRRWYAAVCIGCIPSLIATIFLVTWHMLGVSHQTTWLYLPLFIDGCVATLVVIAALSAFSLAASHSLHGWRLWKTALAVSRLRLGTLFCILIIFAVLVGLCVAFNASLVPLLGAPLAFSLSSVTQQTCMSLQDQSKGAEGL